MSSRPESAVPVHRTARLLALAALLLSAGCQPSSTERTPDTTAAAEEPASVAVDYPSPAGIHREVSQPGAIEAFEETRMFAKVAGYVKEGWKDIGGILHKGEVLAELWAPELVDDLKQKEALIEQADAQIAQAREAEKAAEKAYASAVAQVEVAEANREILLKRQERTQKQYVRLERMGAAVMPREQVEEAQLGYETARASVIEAEAKIKAAQAMRDESKARWGKATADLRAAEASRKVAEKNRDYAKDQVEYLRLTAPYDCVVSRRNVNTRDFVQAATSGKDRPLYIVHRTDLLRVFVEVPETDADWIEKGTTAHVRVPALPGRTFTGQVARISWSLDQTSRTLRAEIDLPNPDGRLRPGMFAHATLSAERSAPWTLPRSAVVTEGDVTRGYQTYCYELRDGEPQRLSIEIGARDDRRVQVLRKQMPADHPGKQPRWVDFTGEEKILRNPSSSARQAR